jgi:protein-tyrosine-phosphatase
VDRIPSSVLFACTFNAVRSPMAAAILSRMHGHRIAVDSVGVRAGELDGFVVAVMEEFGIDVSAHESKTFDDLEDTSFDVIVSLSPEAHHSALELTRYSDCEVVFWNTLDPSIISGNRDERLRAYREVRDQLQDRIRERFPTDLSGGL